MKSKLLCAALLTALACAGARTAQGQDSEYVLVWTGKTENLSNELASLQKVGGRLVANTREGRAVLQVPEASLDAVLTVRGLVEVREIDEQIGEPVRRIVVIPGTFPDPVPKEYGGLPVVGSHAPGGFLVLDTPGGLSHAALTRVLAAGPLQFAEVDYVVRLAPPSPKPGSASTQGSSGTEPNDPRYRELWGMANANAPSAWASVTTSSAVVAVIDTGVDYAHEDLAGNMWKNPGETPGNGKDDDRNGVVDDVYGANFSGGRTSGDPKDDQGHGTHCAGTIAGVGNNAKGVAGVAWKAPIMAVKFLGSDGSGSSADAVRAIDYALSKGARVLSNSWGSYGYSTIVHEAVKRALARGVLFVAAAGNDGHDNDTSPPNYPSSYPEDNVIAVASIQRADRLSTFSNWGATSVDLAAPGEEILSSVPGNQYESYSGTSMATPHVAGAAALVLGHPRHASASWDVVKGLLLRNVRRLPVLNAKCVTGGTLDLRFLSSASQPTAAPRGRLP